MRKKVIGVLLGAVALVAMAGPASAATNNQRFTIVAKFANDETVACRVVATGPIQGTGTCTTSDEGHNVTLIHIVLPNGTVELRAKEVSSTDQFNQAACVATFSFKENFRIVDGTGSYAGATGSGTDSGHGLFTAARTPDGCDPNQGTGVVAVNATGHVRLGSGGSPTP